MTDEEKSRALELVIMYSEASRLVGFLDALGCTQDGSMEDLFIEMSSCADDMKRYFQDRIREATGI